MAEPRITACLGIFAQLACAPLSLTIIYWFRSPVPATCVAAGVADAKDVSMAPNDKNLGSAAAPRQFPRMARRQFRPMPPPQLPPMPPRQFPPMPPRQFPSVPPQQVQPVLPSRSPQPARR